MSAVLSEEEVAIFKADFDSFDNNEDGFIDIDEVPGLLIKQLGRDLTPIEVKATFKRMDTNDDGLVSFSEYMTSIAGSAWEGYAKSHPQDDKGAQAEEVQDNDWSKVDKEAKEKAAVKIQSSFRGKSARRKVKKKRGQTDSKRNSRREKRLAKMKEDEELEALVAEINEAARLKRETEKEYLANLYSGESSNTTQRYKAKEREPGTVESIINPLKGDYIPCNDMQKLHKHEALSSALQ